MRLSRKLTLLGILFFAISAVRGETYVTLQHVSIDRCASAWFITRFIDSDAKFAFFPQGEKPPPGIGFGFYGATYFNHGPDCTFTDLVKKNQKQNNPALQKMNTIVNDVMSWMQGPGSMSALLNNHIADLQAVAKSDSVVLTNIFPTFDLLYWKCGGERNALLEKQRSHCHDFLEFVLLFRCLNEQGKKKINSFLTIDHSTLLQISDSALSRYMDLTISFEKAPEAQKASALEQLVLALNGEGTNAPASAMDWIRTALCEGVETNALNQLYDPRMTVKSGNALDQKTFSFERNLWQAPVRQFQK